MMRDLEWGLGGPRTARGIRSGAAGGARPQPRRVTWWRTPGKEVRSRQDPALLSQTHAIPSHERLVGHMTALSMEPDNE